MKPRRTLKGNIYGKQSTALAGLLQSNSRLEQRSFCIDCWPWPRQCWALEPEQSCKSFVATRLQLWVRKLKAGKSRWLAWCFSSSSSWIPGSNSTSYVYRVFSHPVPFDQHLPFVSACSGKGAPSSSLPPTPPPSLAPLPSFQIGLIPLIFVFKIFFFDMDHFQVFTEFVTQYCFLSYVLVSGHDMWDLSSLAGIRHTCCLSEGEVLLTGSMTWVPHFSATTCTTALHGENVICTRRGALLLNTAYTVSASSQ